MEILLRRFLSPCRGDFPAHSPWSNSAVTNPKSRLNGPVTSIVTVTQYGLMLLVAIYVQTSTQIAYTELRDYDALPKI